ncbi:MAG: DUF3892 domain-containing protein [Candidatus Magasanikbacteria bacterium]
MARIKGNKDGKNGRNRTYNVWGEGDKVPRSEVVRQVKAGKHPTKHVRKRNGREFIADNPDHSKSDNVNS